MLVNYKFILFVQGVGVGGGGQVSRIGVGLQQNVYRKLLLLRTTKRLMPKYSYYTFSKSKRTPYHNSNSSRLTCTVGPR